MLLITENGQDDITWQWQFFHFCTEKGGQHHRDTPLHIQGTPAPYEAVCNYCFKRRMLPFLVFGCHDIDVAIKREGGMRCLDRRAGRSDLDVLAFGPNGYLNPRPGE